MRSASAAGGRIGQAVGAGEVGEVEAVRGRHVRFEHVRLRGDGQEGEDPAAVVVEHDDPEGSCPPRRPWASRPPASWSRARSPVRSVVGAAVAAPKAEETVPSMPLAPAVREHARAVVPHRGEVLEVADRHGGGDPELLARGQGGGQVTRDGGLAQLLAGQDGVDRGGRGGVGRAPAREPAGVGGGAGRSCSSGPGWTAPTHGVRVLPGRLGVDGDLLAVEPRQPGRAAASRSGGRRSARRSRGACAAAQPAERSSPS